MTIQPPLADPNHGSDVEQQNADVCYVVGAVEETGTK